MTFVIKKVNEVEAVHRRLPRRHRDRGRTTASNFRIFLSRQAREKIFVAGSHNPDGVSYLRRENERGGVLLGSLYYDDVDGERVTYTAITDAMPAEEAQAGSTHVEFDGTMLSKVMEEANEHIRKTGQNTRIVGWYHTHPASVSSCLLRTRTRSARSTVRTGNVAIVFDPLRRDYGIFYGKDSLLCSGWYIFDLIAEGFPPPMKLRLRFTASQMQSRQVEEDFAQLKEALLDEFRELFDPIKDII
jgi:hypothetical protein